MQDLLPFLKDEATTVLSLIIIGTAFFFIEKIRPFEKDTRFFKSDFKNEFALALLNALIVLPLYTLLIGFILKLCVFIPYRIFDAEISALPVALQTVIALLLLDFSTYWRHRLSHRFWWPFHSVHHSAEQITWITSQRLHPGDLFFAAIFDAVILYILGFSGAGLLYAFFIMAIYNYFTHANIDVNFPRPVCYIFASPHYHRWHHATDRAAYDKNFCAMFSLLDVIFGTYYSPPGARAEKYGLSPAQQKAYPSSFVSQMAYPFRKRK